MPISTGFYDAKSVIQNLEWQLNQYDYGGGFKVEARPKLSYGATGYKETPGEYEITVTHKAVSGAAWTGIVSGAPNQTVKVRSGAGWQLYTGDLLPTGEKGITVPAGMEGVAPYYTGIQSFTRRLVAAFGEFSAIPEDSRRFSTVAGLFHTINSTNTPQGGQWRTVDESQDPRVRGQTLGSIPGKNVRIGPQTSPSEVERLSYTYSVPIIGDVSKATRALMNQVNEYGMRFSRYTRGVPTPYGSREPSPLGAGAGWSMLYRGVVTKEREETTGGTFLTQRALGSVYPDEAGNTTADRLAIKPYKSYERGGRDINLPMVVTEKTLFPLPERFLRRASTTLGGEEPFSGIPISRLVPTRPLPWVSGQQDVGYPEPVQEYLREKGGLLGAGYESEEKFPIEGITSAAQLLRTGIKLNTGLIGQRLYPGQYAEIGQAPGAEGEDPRRIGSVTGSQIEQYTGFDLALPAAWNQTKQQRRQLVPVLKGLREQGFGNIEWTGVQEPTIVARKIEAGTGAEKAAGIKAFSSWGLVGVPRQVQGGNVPGTTYNALQETSNIDATVLNALQALPKEKLLPFLRTVLPGSARRRLEGYQGGLGLQEISAATGYKSPEQLLYDVTQRSLGYQRQGDEWIATPVEQFTRKQQELNNYLLQEYGWGRVQGKVPLQQFTPETRKLYKRQVISDLMSSTGYDEAGQPTGGMTAREAIISYNRDYRDNIRRTGPKTYTQYAEGDFALLPGLSTSNVEYAGIGSDEGMIKAWLGAIKEKHLQSWFETNYDNLFQQRPVRTALKTVSQLFGDVERGTPGLTGAVIVGGEGGLNPQSIMTDYTAEVGDEKDPTRKLRILTDIIREKSNWKGDTDPTLWFAAAKTGVPLSDVLEQLTSKQFVAGEGEGGLSLEDVTRKPKQLLSLLFGKGGLFQSESVGEQNIIAREMVKQELLLPYVGSKQLFREKGGTSVRYSKRADLAPHEIWLSKNAVISDYLSKGGRLGSYQAWLTNPKSRAAKEWKSYLGAVEGATGIVHRAPEPNVGTGAEANSRDMPGSYLLGLISTEFGQSPRAREIRETIASGGKLPPGMVLSSYGTSLLDDSDADIAALLTGVTRDKNRKGQYRFHAYEPDDRSEFRERMVARTRLEQQAYTAEKIFGATPESPISQAIKGHAAGGIPILGKRGTIDTSNLQEMMRRQAENKMLMGVEYNAYIRNLTASATVLGIPETGVLRGRDVNVAYYQAALDIKGTKGIFESIASNAGFWPKAGTRVGEPPNLTFGYYIGDTAKTSTWSPTGGDIGRLVEEMAKEVAITKGATPEGVASMFMDVPERPEGLSNEEWSAQLTLQRNQIADRLAPAMQRNPREGIPAWHSRIYSAVEGLRKEGLISESSPAIVTALARAASYGNADPERRRLMQQATMTMPLNLGKLGLKTWDEFSEDMIPQQTLFQSLLDPKRVRERLIGGKSALPWLPSAVTKTLERLEQVGALGAQAAKRLLQYAGFQRIPLPGGQPGFRDPITSELVQDQTTKDVEAISAVWKQRKPLVEKDVYSGLPLGTRKIPDTAQGRMARRTIDYMESKFPWVKAVPINVLSAEEYAKGPFQVDPNMPKNTLGASWGGAAWVRGNIPTKDVPLAVAHETSHQFVNRLPEKERKALYEEAKQVILGSEKIRATIAGYNYSEEQAPRELVAHIGESVLSAGGIKAGWEDETDAYKALRGKVSERMASFKPQTTLDVDFEGAEEIPYDTTPKPTATLRVQPQAPETPNPEMRRDANRVARGEVPRVLNEEEVQARDRRRRVTGTGRELRGQTGVSPQRQIEGATRATSAARTQTTGGRTFGAARSNLLSGAAEQAYRALGELTQMNFGTLSGPEGALVAQPGGFNMLGALERFPQLLAEALPSGAQAILDAARKRGGSPAAAYARAMEEAKSRGLDINAEMARVPELQQMRKDLVKMTRLGGLVGRNLDVLPGELGGQYTTSDPLMSMFMGGQWAVGASAQLKNTGQGKLAAQIEQLQGLGEIMGAPTKDKPTGRQAADDMVAWAKSIDVVTDKIKESTKAHGSYGTSLKDIGDKIGNLAEEWAGAGKGKTFETGFGAFVAGREKAAKAAQEISARLGIRPPAPGEEYSEAAIRTIVSRGGGDQLASYLSGTARANLAEQLLLGGPEGPDGGPPGRGRGRDGKGGSELGMLSRRMLGGFGLMYMRSIFGIITGGMQAGYSEYNQQQAQAEQAYGQYMGGVSPMVMPEQRLARYAAAYGGGAGWAGLQTFRAEAAKNPLLSTGMDLAAAAIGGAGAGATMAMWGMQPELSLPFAIGGAALAVAGTGMMGIYGQIAEPERNAVAVAAQIAQGKGPTGPGGRYTGVQNLANMPALGYNVAFQQRQPMVTTLEAMRQSQLQYSRTNLFDTMRGLGVKPADYSRYMSMYAQAQGVQYPGISMGALMTANLMQSTYGLDLTQGPGGTYKALGETLQAGIPIQQIAMQMAGSPNLSLEQQQQRAGSIISSLMSQQARYGTGLRPTDIERYQLGATRREQLGIMAPPSTPYNAWVKTPQQELVPGTGIFTQPDLAKDMAKGTGIGISAAALLGQPWLAPTGAIVGASLGAAFSATHPTWIPEEYKDTSKWKQEQKWTGENFEQRLTAMGEAGFTIYAKRVTIEAERMQMGLAYTPSDNPALMARYTQPTTAQIARISREDEYLGIVTDTQRQYSQAQMRIGVQAPVIPADWTQGQLRQGTQQAQFGMGIESQMLMGGADPKRAQSVAQAFKMMSPEQYAMYEGMFSGNAIASSAWIQQRQGVAGKFPATMPGWGGSQIDTRSLFMTDFNAGGVTGLPWGTTSLAFSNQVSALQGMGASRANAVATSSAASAGSIWGQWAQRTGAPGTGPAVSQGLISAMIEGGTYGGQQYQLNQQNAYGASMDALQMQQFQLTQKYQPKFWALEDQGRNISRGYQTWQLGMQERQLGIQSEQFMANFGINKRQATMQRGWTQQDWSYQDTVRGMQWQWKQEDFQEQARFTTGRERRLAERQMGRETIMFGMEGEQIDKGRERQKELWKLEDQRFALQLKQHQQSIELQKESIERLRQYYKEQWALEDKQRDLSRAQWKEQQALQLKSLEITQAYNAEQRKINQTMLEFSQWSEKLAAGKSLFNPETMNALAEAVAKLDAAWSELLRSNGIEVKPKEGKQHGGLVVAGRRYRVGEAGPETYVPYATGMVYPSNPWNSQMQTASSDRTKSSGQMVLVINLGNETLARKVVDMVDQEVNV
jgi:hypothetical protein